MSWGHPRLSPRSRVKGDIPGLGSTCRCLSPRMRLLWQGLGSRCHKVPRFGRAEASCQVPYWRVEEGACSPSAPC